MVRPLDDFAEPFLVIQYVDQHIAQLQVFVRESMDDQTTLDDGERAGSAPRAPRQRSRARVAPPQQFEYLLNWLALEGIISVNMLK